MNQNGIAEQHAPELNGAFTPAQKEYLQGFLAGVQQVAPFVGQRADGMLTATPSEAKAEPTFFGVPLDELAKEECFKFDENPLDIWDKLVQHADENKFPDAAKGDVYRFKFFGLFYVAPAQDSFMLRCRIPAGVLQAHQLQGLAHMAQQWGNGYLDLTTRANIQLRELKPSDIVRVLTMLQELGLTSRGAGADNVRNITASPTSGFDTQELLDVVPYAKALHHYILNQRDLFGLPRKFNVAFDGSGTISVCADTNDLAFYAVRVGNDIYFRAELGGITGHGDFSRDTGLLIAPHECVAVAAAMLRVFNEHGCRTDRKKARLKYLLESWGVEKFLAETQKKLSFTLRYGPKENDIRPSSIKHAHIGTHAQKQNSMHYVGVVMPVGRMSVEQAQGLAAIATQFGTGELRLTVWQNLIVPHIHTKNLVAVKQALLNLGLHYDPNNIRGGLVACTGNTGCKYAATDTKGHARKLGLQLEARVVLDQPINIHLTGCAHSCAQHYIGDIGLLGTKVQTNGDGEGYHVFIGGGEGATQGLAQQVFSGVPFDDVPPLLEQVLNVYMQQREDGETFVAFARRHSVVWWRNQVLQRST